MPYPMWNETKTGILVDRGNGVISFVESGHEFDAIKGSAADWHFAEESNAAPNRNDMICTPAQMRLALHRLGLLAQVQAIADADPEASIVWEYATQIVRNSPLIGAIGNNFTPDEIDEVFYAAMAVHV